MLKQNMVVYDEECPISEFVTLCRCVFTSTRCLLIGINYRSFIYGKALLEFPESVMRTQAKMSM